MFLANRKLITLAVVLSIFLVVVFLAYRDFTYSFRSSVSDVSSFPLTLVQSLGHEVKAIFLFHGSYWRSLRLRQENEALKERLRQAEGVFLENERLRALLDFKSRVSYKTVTASVIGRDFDMFRPYLLINKGQTSGVRRHAPVLTSSGLAGQALEVGRYSSKVMLVSDPDLAVPAKNGRTGEQGLVLGTLDGRCKLRFLGVDSDIQEGDPIVTSGLNSTYPSDIMIGRVVLVGIEPSGLAKFALLAPAVRVGTLEEVLVAVE